MKEYDDQDPVCAACIEDERLKEEMQAGGEPHLCVLCGKQGPALSIRQLAERLLPVIEEHFQQGGTSFTGEQEGDDLSYVVQLILGHSLDCEDCLVQALVDISTPGPREDLPLVMSDANYVEKPADLTEHYQRWESISRSLKHQRRFFNEDARQFFEWLFEDVDVLNGPGSGAISSAPEPVVRTLDSGTLLFRARAFDTPEDLSKFLKNPKLELGAPPRRLASAGRMSPDGVPVFYGALDSETSIAELRPSIGGRVVVARFEVTKPIRCLDFVRLDRAYWGPKQISYFQDDATVQFGRRAFLRRVHRLISAPVLPKAESEYLITQTLAEYLAHVRVPNFGALAFRSVQRKKGTNVVLFSRGPPDGDPAEPTFDCEYVADSAKCLKVTEVEYAHTKTRYERFPNGSVALHDDDDDEDE
jgi:hypothetical protein